MKRVLFVCLGNICRSPTAHGVFAQMVHDANMMDYIDIDSAGTGDWNVGKPPDVRTQQIAAQRGYDLSPLRARQVKLDDFEQFDLILAMDQQNYRDLLTLSPQEYHHKIHLFLEYGDTPLKEVPDPYYGGEQGFIDVFELVENTARSLLKSIMNNKA